MANKKDKIRITFCGNNADDVTGSLIWIKTPNSQILLECGLFQTAGINLDTYRYNNRHFPFKAKEIDYIFVNHCHADHLCLAPRLYKEGCNGTVIMPEGSGAIANILLRDSAAIMNGEAKTLSKMYKREYLPTYTDTDVDMLMSHFDEAPCFKLIELTPEIKFRFVPSGHIMHAAQLELWITYDNVTKKILYTSDLGNIHLQKEYTEEFVPVQKADIVIGESTYAREIRIANRKTRDKDLEKLKSVISETCITRQSKILIPVFANSRAQEMLTHIYDLYHDDPTFDIPVVIDSPMACRISKAYQYLLTDADKAKWEDVCHWDNIVWASDAATSNAYRSNDTPVVLLSSSGMLTKGRSLEHCKKLLPNPNATILFCGFAIENSLAAMIKSRNHAKLTINKHIYPNRCNVIDLHSFSSHMQRDSLLEYYSSIDCEKVYLVHGEMDGKIQFAKELQKEISKKDRTSKVVVTHADMVVNI